ncbi:MAG: TIGR01212 family radical SAM protein [Planctomycetia bacterium]|nr:TIGR01212 family radical SAM protein [Planctomycetia bacterium]
MSKDVDWRQAGHRYYPLAMYMRHEFGEPVWKISLDAHFSCPNIDGTVGREGCLFCDAKSFSPGRRFGLENLEAQMDDGITQLQRRHSVRKFLAYFQPSTNTYAPVERLESIFRRAMRRSEIVGLAIGTRPDALPDDVLDLLADLSKETRIFLEIGLQSAKNESLRFLNRGHNYETFADAIERAQKRNLCLGTHLILGIPGETRDDLIRTAQLVAQWKLHSIKLHNLYVVRNTKLAELWTENKISLPTCQEYAEMVVDFLEYQNPETVIERISGEASEEYLLAPQWTAIKHSARNAVDRAFRNRNTYQGKLWR